MAKNGVTVFRERVIQMSRNQPGHVQILGSRLLLQVSGEVRVSSMLFKRGQPLAPT